MLPLPVLRELQHECTLTSTTEPRCRLRGMMKPSWSPEKVYGLRIYGDCNYERASYLLRSSNEDLSVVTTRTPYGTICA